MAAGVHAPIGRLDFTVPSRLEAHEPPEARGLRRDGVRLLVSHVNDDHIFYARFCDLPTYLRPGDLVVVNASATLPAALTARRHNGSEVAVHVSTQLPAGLVVAEFRNLTPSHGEEFALPGAGSVVALVPYPGSMRLWVARFDLPEPLLAYLARWGRPITYPYVRGTWPIEMYQNVYASVPGSAEMPSAGRPFTPEILDRLAPRGIFLRSGEHTSELQALTFFVCRLLLLKKKKNNDMKLHVDSRCWPIT